MKVIIQLLLLVLAAPAFADKDKLLDYLAKIESNPAQLQAAQQAGDSRALLCKFCHGADGNSKKPSIPNLAGQNTQYLITQFELFATGKRTNKTMNELADVLSPADKVNIAVFYSAQEAKPQPGYKPELQSTGKRLFETRCFFCHGHDARGKEDLPRVASQPAEFLVRTLSSYTSNLVKRAETQMSAIARTLKPDEIEALAAYLSHLE